ncbi:MAG: DUF4157 domain-containing protein [Rhodovulum sp.]
MQATADPATAAARLAIQPKLTLGQPGDRYEAEADHIAEQVVSDRPIPLTGPLPVTPLVQRQPEEEEEDEEELQMKSAGRPAPTGAAIEAAAAAVASGGRPLSRAERSYFEPRFGRDLSAVRLHDGARAASAAGAIGARAYTLGRNVAFAAGQYDPASRDGRRLMAHELTHTLQQGAGVIRRQGPAAQPAAPVRPTQVTFNFNENQAIPAAAGGTQTLTASTNGTQVTWSITAGTAAVAAGTTIAANGDITLDAAQVGGTLNARATNSAGWFEHPFRVASVPTGISATALSSALNSSATDYGWAFQHTFTSANGSQTVLENLRIGEHFPTAPSPNAASHVFSGQNWPFGRGADSFTLSTGTLANDAAGSWALDSAGQFGPVPAGSTLARGDNVSTAKAGINVGDHVLSHSNTQPRNRLPVSLTLTQEFHYFNQRAAAGSRWTRFTTTAHSRTLRRRGTDVEFVTTVNGVEKVQDYVGKPAVTNLTASPANTPKSATAPPAAPAPAARTVSLSVEALPSTLPTGTSLNWTFVGNRLGCSIAQNAADPTRATLTIGTTAGTVTVQVADNTGTNSDRVTVTIT